MSAGGGLLSHLPTLAHGYKQPAKGYDEMSVSPDSTRRSIPFRY